jgi:hypothetical protein
MGIQGCVSSVLFLLEHIQPVFLLEFGQWTGCFHLFQLWLRSGCNRICYFLSDSNSLRDGEHPKNELLRACLHGVFCINRYRGDVAYWML